MFSERSDFEEEENALSRARREARGQGRVLLDLCASNPTTVGLEEEVEALREAFAGPLVAPYEPASFGLLSAREALAVELAAEGLDCPADRVLLSASTSEAYAMLFTLLCDPGDELLVPEPSYPLLAHLAQLQGVHLVRYPLHTEGGGARWEMDAGALWDRISPRCRGILAVSPNNPTGSLLLPEEVEALSALGLPLIVDEVFAGYPLEIGSAEEPPRGAIAHASVLCFALRGLSKHAAMPQMKLAWTLVGGPEDERREALRRLELIADAYLSPGGPVQRALPALLEIGGRRRAALLARARHNLATLRARLAEGPLCALTLPRVEGGWYAPLRLPRTRSDEEWALSLLEERGLLVHPGYFYDFPDEEAWIVLSLIVPEADFDEGLDRIEAFVAEELSDNS